ncbi:hypothetical protein [Dysgonomonas macrotermitis]|uniref:Uncharacterized protein n=1 Tax=Dysgonomonas macrotermitis TaxID=1346286 RepID=A0A1M5CLH7_9BACT|nr:hypothetical protein [Dysgonomonas macrotermitis]SHF55282.1 hypothetical protein SAMN05444362_107202 [Dysgonomonas macrotermitis]
MKKVVFFTLFCVSAFICWSQNPKYNVPEEYSLVLPEDYSKYEPQILETIDWYLWRSVALDADRQKEASIFFMKWITGSPTVTVDIHIEFIKYTTETPGLLMPFIMGWVKYSLENNYSKDRVKACNAGIVTAVNYYNKNKGFLSENKEIKKYENLIKKNKLEKFISDVFSSAE